MDDRVSEDGELESIVARSAAGLSVKKLVSATLGALSRHRARPGGGCSFEGRVDRA